MIKKGLKIGLVVVAVAVVLHMTGVGRNLVSYMHTSARSVQQAVKGQVPIEFELQRARDLLEEVIPEMHANIRLIAQEEVEVANLKNEITKSSETLADERGRIDHMRQSLNLQNASYTFGEFNYTRSEVKEELARRFERFKEAELVMEGKKRLLAAREKSLKAAIDLLSKTRSKKMLLEDKIEGLTSQYRLIKTASVESDTVKIDDSKLARTEKLINEIDKRLEVSERVLAYESKFVQEIPVEDTAVTENDLLDEIDDYFAPTSDQGEVDATKTVDEICQTEVVLN